MPLLLLLLVFLRPSCANQGRLPSSMDDHYRSSSQQPERAMSHSNQSPMDSIREKSKSSGDVPGQFAGAMKRCLGEHGNQIAENFSRGRIIIQNCFKSAVMFSFFECLTASPNRRIEILGGFLELVKASDRMECDEVDCGKKYGWQLDDRLMERISAEERNEYLYGEAVKNVAEEDPEASGNAEESGWCGETEENNLNAWRKAIGCVMEEKTNGREEELLKNQSVSMVNDLFRNYRLKIRIYPGVFVGLKRSREGRFDFDVESESENPDAGDSGEVAPDARSEGRKRKKKIKGGFKKKKVQKMLQKMMKHLMIPMIMQLAILPFFMKKLFLLALKSLLAGKTALLLIAFNMMRNYRYQNEDHLVRVEHYGYRAGEEYGAWINGRKFG